MAEDSFDTANIETFLELIEQHPQIWNPQLNKVRADKQQAWSNISDQLFGVLPDAEKEERIMAMTAKWKNLKDSYQRSKRSNRKSVYIYEKLLRFMDPVMEYRKQNPSTVFPTRTPLKTIAPKKSRISSKASTAVVFDESGEIFDDSVHYNYVVTPQIDNRGDTEEVKRPGDPLAVSTDEDRYFFESLVPVVKQFSVDQKLQFRVEVINLMQRIRTGTGLKDDVI